MSKRAILAVFVVIVCAIALVAWLRQRSYNHYNAGEVTAIETRESASAAVEPQPEQISKKEPAGHPIDESEAVQPVEKSNEATDTDKATPDANEGTRTAGSGRFQAYRQGNLTWRLDTETGTACVLFATDEEWLKPRVSGRACARD